MPQLVLILTRLVARTEQSSSRASTQELILGEIREKDLEFSMTSEIVISPNGRKLLQLRVLGFGLLQDVDARIPRSFHREVPLINF